MARCLVRRWSHRGRSPTADVAAPAVDGRRPRPRRVGPGVAAVCVNRQRPPRPEEGPGLQAGRLRPLPASGGQASIRRARRRDRDRPREHRPSEGSLRRSKIGVMKQPSVILGYLLCSVLAHPSSNTPTTNVSPGHASPPSERLIGIPPTFQVTPINVRSDVLTSSLTTSPGSSRRAVLECGRPPASWAVTITSSNMDGDMFFTSTRETPRIARPQPVFQNTTTAMLTQTSTPQLHMSSHRFFMVRTLPRFTQLGHLYQPHGHSSPKETPIKEKGVQG